MNIFKPLGLAALSLFAVSAFTSCEEHNPFSEQEIFQQEYSKNFFKTYGNFPANQSWDFSDQPRTASTDPSVFDLGSGKITRATTRATAHKAEATDEVELADAISQGILTVPSKATSSEDVWPKVDDPYYYMEPETFKWLQENLVEGRNNTGIGSPFVFRYESPTSSDKKFAIIPIYQGHGTVKYKLHMVAVSQDKDYIIWENWPDGNGGPTTPDTGVGTSAFQVNSDEDYPAPHSSTYWRNIIKNDDLSGLARKNIRSIPMIISKMEGEFYFYLEVTQSLTSYAYEGEHMSSKEGMMLAINCPVPNSINNYKSLLGVSADKTISQTMVLGCEDTRKSDWDINDIVFLVVGLTDLPQKREATHSKRYLIEDLGTTVDFDFNDVVVDVTETVIINPDGTEGQIYTQEAVIRHLCGTVPFTVSFNNGGNSNYSTASFGEIQGIVQGTNEEYMPEGNYVKIQYTANKTNNLTGIVTDKPFWISSENNIQINVGKSETLEGQDWSAGNGGVNTANFNKPGETKAPYIIAVPTTVMWTAESQNFPIDKVSQYNQ